MLPPIPVLHSRMFQNWVVKLITWVLVLLIRSCLTLENSGFTCLLKIISMGKTSDILNLNKVELENDVPFEQSWHQTYRNCPWVYFGGVSPDLSEGDIICMFSQFVFLKL